MRRAIGSDAFNALAFLAMIAAAVNCLAHYGVI